jgi:nicotinamidase-related amidase
MAKTALLLMDFQNGIVDRFTLNPNLLMEKVFPMQAEVITAEQWYKQIQSR